MPGEPRSWLARARESGVKIVPAHGTRLAVIRSVRSKTVSDLRCSYVVLVDRVVSSPEALRELAEYLSAIGLHEVDVVVLDGSPAAQFDETARVLRWVARHVAVKPEHRTATGTVDVVRTAIAVAGCEKVIVAAEDVRYTPEAIGQLCDLLDQHEVVEPQDYLDPLPWWGGIEAGRILVHRGVEPEPDHGVTFGFRRTAVRSLRSLAAAHVIDDQTRRLSAVGAEVYAAPEVFVKRQPAPLGEWLTSRPREAGEDFALPMKSAFFFSLLPMLLMLAALGGLDLAGGYAGVIAFASVALAMRGRAGAAPFFPLRSVLFAPIWVLERSLSVYWALFRKLSGSEIGATGVAPSAGETSPSRLTMTK